MEADHPMTANYLNDDGTLRLARWGDGLALATGLVESLQRALTPMYGTRAMAAPLVTNGALGVDLVRVPAGQGFQPHVHPGDHLLICVEGQGTITYDGRIYPTEAGQVYLIEGAVPHAVGAITDHSILAVGSPHRAADSADRMELTDYLAVATELGTITCLICNDRGTVEALAARGCVHAPVPRTYPKPVVVGLARASATQGPFQGTTSGLVLAQLLNVPPHELDHAVTLATLTEEAIEFWDQVPMEFWASAARVLAPSLVGQVVVCCGEVVAAAISEAFGCPTVRPFGSMAYPQGTLVLTIPHPSTLPHRGTSMDDATWESERLLAVACKIAAAGPINGEAFSNEDAWRATAPA